MSIRKHREAERSTFAVTGTNCFSILKQSDEHRARQSGYSPIGFPLCTPADCSRSIGVSVFPARRATRVDPTMVLQHK